MPFANEPFRRLRRDLYSGMPRRPLPNIPHGPRRKRGEPGVTLLAYPRLSPEWELAALAALMKPQKRGPILHRKASQPWPAGAAARIAEVCQLAGERLGVRFDPQFPPAGDFHMILPIDPPLLPAARGLALLLSMQFPAAWLTVDRLLVHRGKFFRRRRGIKLRLTPAANVRLLRDVRAALADLLARAPARARGRSTSAAST